MFFTKLILMFLLNKHNTRRVLLGVFAAFSCINTNAQNIEISGILIDSIKNNPLCPANIILRKAENNNFICGTITNYEGNFKIQNVRKGKYIIQLSYIGFKVKEIPISVNDIDIKLGKIPLSQSTFKIDEITVIYKPILEFNEENVTLNIEMLGDVEYLSVAEAIDMVPGAYFDFEGKFHYFGYSNFTTLIDGEKTGTNSFFETVSGEQEYVKLKTIPAKFIKSVEIFPDPQGKYGYFTPIINIIPKGDLSDFYKANCNAGCYNKYNAEFGIVKKKNKFKIAPDIQYENIEENQKQIENRNYYSDESSSYFKETNSESVNSNGNISFGTSYRFRPTHSLSFSSNNNIYSYQTNQNLKQIEYNDGSNALVLEKTDNSPKNYKYSLQYRNVINLARKKKLMLSITGSLTNSTTNENQIYIEKDTITEDTKYKLSSKKEEKSGNLNFGYYNYKHKINYSILGNLPISSSTSYNNRELYNNSLDTWEELSIYSGDNIYLKTVPKVTFKLTRKIKGTSEKSSSTHHINAAITEQFGYEKMNNLLENTEETDKVFKTNISLSFRKSFNIYGNYSVSYGGNILMPGNKQKTATPEYIDESTIVIGNPDLQAETLHRFSMKYLWSSSGIMVISTSGNKTKAPQIGYSINLDYTLSSNKIVQDFYEEDGVAIYSWTNKDSFQSFSLENSFDWRMNTNTKLSISANYNIDKYKGENSTYCWGMNSQFKHKFSKKISCDLKYSYNSARDYYNKTISAKHNGSVSLSALAFKNSMYLSLEATKIFANMGSRTEVSGTSFFSRKEVYPESFVVWIHASLKLFKFYKK